MLEKLEKPVEENNSKIINAASYYIQDLQNKVQEIKTIDNIKPATSIQNHLKLNSNNYYSYNYYEKNRKYSHLPNDKRKQSLVNKFDLPQEASKENESLGKGHNFNYNKKGYNNRSGKKESLKVPLNKDYKIDLEEEEGLKFNKIEISEKYEYLDFAKIFFNLNLLYKTDKPKEYETNFIPEIMRETPKKELDFYKKKERIGRDRAQTFFESRRSKIK